MMEESEYNRGLERPETSTAVPVEIAEPRSTPESSVDPGPATGVYESFRDGFTKAQTDAEQAAEFVVPKVREYASKAALGAAYGAAYGVAFGAVFTSTVAQSFVPDRLKNAFSRGARDAENAAAAVLDPQPDTGDAVPSGA